MTTPDKPAGEARCDICGNTLVQHQLPTLFCPIFATFRTPPPPALDDAALNKAAELVADMCIADPTISVEATTRAAIECYLAALLETHCHSCGGLNLSCPVGCERDPKTGELNLTPHQGR